jgi:hypothetical protein
MTRYEADSKLVELEWWLSCELKQQSGKFACAEAKSKDAAKAKEINKRKEESLAMLEKESMVCGPK